MDPEANTQELKTLITDMNQIPNSDDDWHHDAQRAWDLTDALQQWMQNQGFKPN